MTGNVLLGCARAYVVRVRGASVTEEELIDYTVSRLAAYKRPRFVRFVDALPATSTGKIMRRALITQFPE
jgi:long-chain acyl-CoA synthetase